VSLVVRIMRFVCFFILFLSTPFPLSLVSLIPYLPKSFPFATASDPHNTTASPSAAFILSSSSSSPSATSSSSKSSPTHAQKRDSIAQSILKAMKSGESCDWKAHPILFLSGILCGKHYKILQLPSQRSSSFSSSSSASPVSGPSVQEIRSRYYELSKVLHPDKNPVATATSTTSETAAAAEASSKAAQEAFVLLTESYQCLKSKSCKENYDFYLSSLETENWLRRAEKWQRWQRTAHQAIYWTHHSLSIAANIVDQGPSLPSLLSLNVNRRHVSLETIRSCQDC
jgi:hypothetical protein